MDKNASTIIVPDRRERFREFMKRFNPAAPAKAAIGDGLICQRPGQSIFKKLAARADLTPGCQQLLVGGIGSGKTTELLMAETELRAQGHTLPLYIDISAETDLSVVESGALLVSLGMRVWEVINSQFDPPKELAEVNVSVRKFAYGYEDEEVVWPRKNKLGLLDLDITLKHNVPGKLKPPISPIHGDNVVLTKLISKLTDFLKGHGLELVAIFDGLDRLIRADKFWSVSEQALRALKLLEISVLAAGPLSIMYGEGRQVKDYFEEV